MPKRLNYEKIGENKYNFDSKLNLFGGSNCIIRGPTELGKKYSGKKIKVTIEVLEK